MLNGPELVQVFLAMFFDVLSSEFFEEKFQTSAREKFDGAKIHFSEGFDRATHRP